MVLVEEELLVKVYELLKEYEGCFVFQSHEQIASNILSEIMDISVREGFKLNKDDENGDGQ